MANQSSPYVQLHRDIVIAADIYGGQDQDPRILAAGMGFEGIMNIPGLNSEADIDLAYQAGAGVVDSLLGLDPSAPLRNITSALGPGFQVSGYANNLVSETFLDAMPIEFSHPLLPSTVLPENFRIRLNNGETAIPLYVGLIPNYDFNERQTMVAMGYFSNGLKTGDKDSIYPVQFDVVNSDNPLQLVTSDGLFNGSGLSSESNNPYDDLNGPLLVGAKLSRLSLAGDYTNPINFTGPNHGVESYGTSKDLYRLRLFTGGGFSPDGVSGLLPDDFSNYFQLEVDGPDSNSLIVDKSSQTYEVKGGSISVLGIADLAGDVGDDPDYLYVEDHDNQFDLIIQASSRRAAKAIKSVIIPDPRLETHSPLYNPGGPGTDPVTGMLYTQPSPGQTIDVEQALKDPGVVSWAGQELDNYDLDNDLSVAFRLHNHKTGAWRMTDSSKKASRLVAKSRWSHVGVPFAVNPSDSYVVDVFELKNNSAGNKDFLYLTDESQIEGFESVGYVNEGAVFQAYSEAMEGLNPVYQMVSPAGTHALTASEQQQGTWIDQGWLEQGVPFYSVGFPNTDLLS